MAFTFRFRWIPFIAAVIVAAIGVQLGQWQTRRAQEKEAIAARQAARTAEPSLDLNAGIPDIDRAEYRRAEVAGVFRSDWPLFLENRPHDGQAGFDVLMPLRIADTDRYLLVARGWVARDPTDRMRLPPLQTPAGQVKLEGVLRHRPAHLLQLGASPAIQPGAILQNLEIPQLAAASKLDMLPFMLEQTSDSGDGLVRDWPQPSAGSDRSRGYAFQWYGLAATALIFFIVTGFKRGKK
jgi:cytochrome oxidase assembly protein ShyY1